MGKESKISWCDATWNVVTGCTPVSEGCKHCYARRDWARLSANPKTRYFGRAFADVKCHPEFLDTPLLWKKPALIFVNSMSDLFHPDVPFLFLNKVFDTIDKCRHHTFMVLTKRPGRMLEYLSEHRDIGRPNLWLGVTAENQPAANYRIQLLRQMPAVRFVSIEPMLRPVDVSKWLEDGSLDWVIVGCESGPHRREMDHDWARSIKDQCRESGIPFFMKQLDVGGKVERDIELFPDDLRVREWPD
jgi:protein gp37